MAALEKTPKISHGWMDVLMDRVKDRRTDWGQSIKLTSKVCVWVQKLEKNNRQSLR